MDDSIVLKLFPYPIFKCEEIYYDDGTLGPGPYKIAVGKEKGCSFYTKAVLVETNDKLDEDALKKIIKQVEDLLSGQGG